MAGPFTKDKIENWVHDFCGSDAVREFSAGTREYAADVLARFLTAACDVRDVEPDELEEADLKAALLEHVRMLQLPVGVRGEIPALCGAFLTQLEADGRLGGGRAMGVYVRALRESFADDPAKPKPITRPGSKIGRNDPCPCGSGKKYKKCCGT